MLLPLRLFLSLAAFLWLALEWALVLPPLLREGFVPWHAAALRRLTADTAFELVALDYALALAVAVTLSVADARRRSRRPWLWTVCFFLFTAPAILFYWANRPVQAGDDAARVEP